MKYLNISILFFLAFACRQNSLPPSGSPYEVKTPRAIEIDGLSFVAPPRGFAIDPMQAVKKVGAGWIAVIPYAYTLSGDTKVHFNSPRQWWGERVEGVIESIARAQAVGIKVMLKPQVYFPGSWPGGIDFSEEADWQIWESNYRKYIMTFVAIADSMSVPMFCVGTEFKVSEQKRPNFWRKLIRDIRKVYKGKLTYAANWDSFDQVPFWDALDYVGIDAYFPLVDTPTPTHEELLAAWQKPLKVIRRFWHKLKKPILFTEFGYMSVDACAHKTWELESDIHRHPINQQAQANALNALFTVFAKEEYWAGGFLWKWFPNMEGHEGYPASDYTPQGKIAEKVLEEWYRR